MPSETMDVKRFSSSSRFSDDRQVGFWKPDATADHFGCERPVASYPLEKFVPKEGQIMKSPEHSEPQPMQDQKVKVGVVRNAVGAERAVNRSSIMSKSLDNDTVQPMPYFAENNKINLMGTQYENNLFSSSFSDLFSQNMRLTLNNTYGQSVDTVASHCEEEEPLESIEEIEAQTIGDLLPDDDDLLSGVTEGLQHIVQPNGGDDLEEMDLFSSIGGMDLGDDNSSTRQRNSEFPRGYSQGMLNFDTRSNHNFNPQSLPEYQGGLTNCSSSSTLAANINPRPVGRIDNKQLGRVSSNGHVVEQNEGVFGSPGNVSGPLTGHHYPWSNSFHHHPPGLMWSNSPPASFVNGGVYTTHPQQRLHGLPKAPPHMLKPVFPDHHVGSAPAVNHWNRRPLYSGQSPEASGFRPGSLGNMRIPNNSLHSMELGSRNFYPHSIGNAMDMSVPPRNGGLQSHHQSCMMFPGRTQMIPMMNSFDSHSERVRSRRNEGGPNQGDSKKQYELDIERIKRGEDNRTTLMIKNIPNKYTSKMLLAAIDEHHRGTYDFLYLPIDFKNKCNVGYAFINMTDPLHIIPYYQAFNGKKWEKFNSEKVASIAYARIQGKAALVSHFQNSSLMNEDKRCRPILFNTDGPNPGDQVPFPMGVNIRTKPGKTRTTTREENHDCSNGDSSSASGRESD